MRKINFVIIFILVKITISHDILDQNLLSIYIDENGIQHYEYPKNYSIKNKLIINKEGDKYFFDKNMTKKEIDNAMNYKSTWEPCKKLNCVHGHCFLMVEALSENWAYCECDEGFYGSDCQYTYGQSLKLNLKSTFFIDLEKGTVLDKINDFFNYNIIPKTIEEIYEVISMGKNLIDFYTNPIKNWKKFIAINSIKKI